MSSIYLSLVFHNHQPVGNFNFVFKDAFEKAYLPLTECLDRHPTIPVAIHFTGPLIDWLKQNQPDYLQHVAQQVQRGQVEILSGAYYEPILAMLLDEDKIGQIKKMNDAVEEIFGTKASGMWLAERIWEPHLAKPLHEAGIDYTVIDDTHFQAAGFSPEQLFGYFVTEEQGHPLKLVPTQNTLRHTIPWQPVSDTIDWLREQSERESIVGKPPMWAVFGDDGEKFGYWSETFDQVWNEGWLDELFEAIEENANWLQTILPRDYIQEYRAWGRAYLPTESYSEMGEWSLPSPHSHLLRELRETYELELEYLPEWDQNKRDEIERVLHFLRGSFWRNFLVKYPEINHMQKRGLVLSQYLHSLPPSKERDEALDALWAAQCNCGYWHGIFGGIYLFHIRTANYTNLIKAQKLLYPDETVWSTQTDFNADSYDEILAGNGILTAIVEPSQGGMMTELDYRPAYYNLLNVMTRHPEGYHIQIQEAAATHMLMTPGDDPNKFEGEPIRVKERGLENVIYQDWHRRGMFVDHFLGQQATLYGFESVQYPEQGDFVNNKYEFSIDQNSPTLNIHLKRDGYLWVGELRIPVRIEKTFCFEEGKHELQAHYRLTNNSDNLIESRFGVEMAFGFDGGDNQEYCYLEHYDQKLSLGKSGEFGNATEYHAISKIRNFKITFELSEPATLWRFPLAPITLSDGGFERVHQGVVTMPIWNLALASGESWEFDLKLSISSLGEK